MHSQCTVRTTGSCPQEGRSFAAEDAEIAEIFLFVVFSAYSACSAVREFG